MGVTAAAAAKQNKLKINAEWRARRRTTSDAFKKAEQESRDRYNEFTKLSREFSKAYPNEFKNFLMAKSRGIPVPRQSFGLPHHMPPVVPSTPAEDGLRPPPIQLPDFKSVSSSGRVPSAQAMEARRLPAANTLAALGIRLD